MRTTGIIAGSLGLTVVVGAAALIGVVGAGALLAWRPVPVAPDALRATVERHGEVFGACARTVTAPGTVTLLLTTEGGQARKVEVEASDLPHPVTTCVAQAAATLPWPDGRGAARVPVRVEPWTR